MSIGRYIETSKLAAAAAFGLVIGTDDPDLRAFRGRGDTDDAASFSCSAEF